MKEKFISAAALLHNHKFCKNVDARDKSRNECSPLSPQATHFCAAGAVAASSHYLNAEEYKYYTDFNDKKRTTKKEVVLALLFEAYRPE